MGLPLMDANKVVAELKDREDYELLAFLLYLVGQAAPADLATPLGTLKAGQVAKPIRAMAEDFKLSKSTIHRRLKALKGLGLIAIEGTGKGARITLLNFESYRRTEEGKPILPAAPPTEAPTEAKVKAPKKVPKFDDDSPALKLAHLLFRFIQIRIPSAKEPNFQTWAYDADLMLRVDGRSYEDTERLLRYSQKHAFWQRNILSIDKLRKHFDRLTMEMHNESTDANQPSPSLRPQHQDAASRRERRFHQVVAKYS